MFQCQFCSNIFVTKKILNHHQLKVKYCLKIQQAKEDADAKTKTLLEAFVEAKEKEKKELEAKERKEAEEQALKEIAKELTCQFCNKEFKTKYLLRIHQTQAKYCLKIQESQNSEEIIVALVTCKFCNKNFSSSHFNRHSLSCKKKIQSLIEENAMLKMKAEKDEEIARMKTEKAEEISLIYKASAERSQVTIDEIAKRPTYQKNSTRNIQNNLMISSLTPLDLSQARVDSIIDEKYTKNDFYEGQKGAAQVIHKHILTDDSGKSQIVCTDTERGTFHHIDVNGEHIVDYKNAHLIDRVHLPLKIKASKFASEECVKNPTAYKDIVMNESSIRELEIKPGLFNRTMAQLTGKNCAKPLLVKSESNSDLTITEEWLIENAKFLTIEHMLRGPEGYADYALSYPLNGRLIEEEDYSNPTFIKYKDRKGDIITDYGGTMLLKMLFESVRERTHELIESNDTVRFECEDIEDSIFQEAFISIVMINI